MKIYTKLCIQCVAPQALESIQRWAVQNYHQPFEVVRTTYRPKLHEEATAIYGAPDYTFFIEMDGKVHDFYEFANKVKEGGPMFKTKAKPVKKGKKK